MPQFLLHKINILPIEVPADTHLHLHRTVAALSKRQHLDVLWRQLDCCRVIKFKREYYALDNLLLISVLAAQFPQQQISVLEIPVKTEKELKQRVVDALIINSLCAIKPTKIPVFERSCSRQHQTVPMFNATQWSENLGVHRTTLYPKSTKSDSHHIAAPVDLCQALKKIPLPKNRSFS